VKRVKEVLKEYGWQLDTCHADEMYAGNGGPHCMTCPVLVD
jgi:arginine deiminase